MIINKQSSIDRALVCWLTDREPDSIHSLSKPWICPIEIALDKATGSQAHFLPKEMTHVVGQNDHTGKQ